MPAISSLHKCASDLSEKIQTLHLAGASVKSACRDQQNDTCMRCRGFKETTVKADREDGCWNRILVIQHKKKKKKESGKQGPVLTTLHNYVLKNYVLHSE